ncbi:hypothetical protein [Leptotrichia sp. oral taxon 847]|uniref:hypothetical protein n=1 Tax=Leptotrichia sp. oral taxon 847 TaxID=1785996 RepID=UPI000767F07D|nr:hypothetical protein [Leptotrichia sp. oral taxon 847]AMD94591.1 hypothetical protein AXF11_02580 [Leptotrichia sp. oral taxon 847]
MKIDKNLNRTTIRAMTVITGLMVNINDRNIKRKNNDGIDTTRPNNIIKVISSGVYFLSDLLIFIKITSLIYLIYYTMFERKGGKLWQKIWS